MTRRGTATALLALPLLAVPPLALPVLAVSSGAAAGTCAAPTITGTDEDDVLLGTEGPDVIDGLGGDDEITGLGGDDVLCGGAGADTVAGGPGDDVFDLGTRAWTGRSADVLSFRGATSGIVLDLVAGTATGEGSDRVVGSATFVLGSEHDDVIRGTDERDHIYGYGGSDRIHGGGGHDRINGAGHPEPDHTPADGDDVLRGGPGNDVLNGGDADDVLRGGPGDDVIEDPRGAEVMRGGTGDDSIFGSRGPDDVRGGPGGDRFVYVVRPAEDRQVLLGGPGRDHLELYFGASRHLREKAVVHVDLGRGVARARSPRVSVAVRVLSFEDAAATSGRRWYVRGTDGPNRIYALPQASLVARGLGGDDSLGRSFLDDVLDGGPGHDEATGPLGGQDRYLSVEKIL